MLGAGRALGRAAQLRLAQLRLAQLRLAQAGLGVALEMQVECRGREVPSIEPDSRRAAGARTRASRRNGWRASRDTPASATGVTITTTADSRQREPAAPSPHHHHGAGRRPIADGITSSRHTMLLRDAAHTPQPDPRP